LQETRVVNENVIVYSSDLKLYLINIETGEKGLGTPSSAATEYIRFGIGFCLYL